MLALKQCFCVDHCSTHLTTGKAVDQEHEHYSQVEASLEFLTERLAAVERAGAGEDAEYERSSAALHQQLEEQASCLVACQLRIATLKEELAASKQRMEDEQLVEAELAEKARQLEAEAAAAGSQLGEPALTDAMLQHIQENPLTINEQIIDSKQQQQQQAQGLVREDGLAPENEALAKLEAQQLLSQLDTVLQQSTGVAATDSNTNTAGDAAAAGFDMSVVRQHVEEMAKQYVRRLAEAEEELRAVRTVWQQAEAELAALRRQQQINSSNGGRRSPTYERRSPRSSADSRSESAGTVDLSSLRSEVNPAVILENQGPGLNPADDDAILEISTIAPVFAPEQVSGTSHAAADAEHAMPDEMVLLDLPTPVFGAGSSSSSRWGPSGAGSRMAVVAAAAAESADSSNGQLPKGWGQAAADAAAALTAEDVEALQMAAEQTVHSSSANCRIKVRRAGNSGTDSGYNW